MRKIISALTLALVLLFNLPIFAAGNQEEIQASQNDQPATEQNENETLLTPVAEALGISVQNLAEALGDPSQGAPDFDDAAKKLGIDAAELEQLMKEMMNQQEAAVQLEPYTVTLNGFAFTITDEVFTWAELPDDIKYVKQPVLEFTNATGDTHYYEVVYLQDGNLNWYQTAYLAQDAGGYLACPESDDENTFIFNQVNDIKFFWAFPEEGEHYGISIGPFLGGFQPDGSEEPAGGWTWLSGEPWSYTNWARNIDDGVVDKDPRDNTQPNDSGDGQPIMGFGELNLPVPTWGDYMESIGTYGKTKLPGRSYGFIIEYDSKPE